MLCTVGLFDTENSIEQQTFELAVQKVNIDPMFSNVFLKANIQLIDSEDAYKTGLKGSFLNDLLAPVVVRRNPLTDRLNTRPR